MEKSWNFIAQFLCEPCFVKFCFCVSVLDDDDNDLSIQKITESLSIRKHTVQRKLKRMKNM